MTPMQRRRTIIREVIETEGPSPDNLRFIHSALAICGLPYRRPAADVREFERKQGRMSVLVEAGKARLPDGSRVAQPLPWGPKARLIMAHLSTEAIRQQSPTVEIADSLTGFMREMGFERTGGPRGNIAPFKEQIQALAVCRMEISAWDGKRAATIDTKPFERLEVWLSDNRISVRSGRPQLPSHRASTRPCAATRCQSTCAPSAPLPGLSQTPIVNGGTILHLTRSSLHRCLQRHGISRLPDVDGDKPTKRKFKAYAIGYFHIDIAEVRTAEGLLHLFVGGINDSRKCHNRRTTSD